MSRGVLRGPAAPGPRHDTIPRALAAAARSATGLAFVDAQERETALSFADLFLRARRAAAALRSLGIAPGDRVALVLPTGTDFMDAFFGVLCAGGVPVPLYPPLRLGRLEEYHRRTARMLARSGARLLLTDARMAMLLGVAVAQARPALGCRTVAGLRDRASGEHLHEGTPTDLALVQFSSGTTVEPKPVALTHENILANAAAIDAYLVGSGASRQSGVSWLPLYHDMGLIGCLLLAVVHPGPLALIPPELFLARPALWLRVISRRRATVSVAPNFAYGLCLKRVRDEELEGVDLSAWKLALDGAEPVSPEVLRQFADRFSRFGFDPRALTPVYGLSEAALAVTFAPPGRGVRTARLDAEALARDGRARTTAEGEATPRREITSLGCPLPGFEVRIRDGAGADLPERSVGRVHVRGPSVMRGYLDDPQATAGVLVGGWLHTGDLGFVLEGELYLCGREKELVILRGKNHAPQEFEDALEGLPGLRAGCAVALGYLPEEAGGEELLLLLERDPAAPAPPDGGPDPLVELARSRVLERTAVRARDVRIFPPGTLPRTSSGKLRRGEALRAFLEGTLSPPRRTTLIGLALQTARSMTALAALRLRR